MYVCKPQSFSVPESYENVCLCRKISDTTEFGMLCEVDNTVAMKFQRAHSFNT